MSLLSELTPDHDLTGYASPFMSHPHVDEDYHVRVPHLASPHDTGDTPEDVIKTAVKSRGQRKFTIEPIDFLKANHEYLYASAETKTDTTLAQIIDMYIQTYNRPWPWNQNFTTTEVWESLHRLTPNALHESFCFLAKQEGKVVGGIWGVDTSALHAGFWLKPGGRYSPEEQMLLSRAVNKGRDQHGWKNERITIVQEALVASATAPTGTARTIPELLHVEKSSVNPRANGEVAYALLRATVEKQIAAGVPEYVGWTVRNKNPDVGKQARMYLIVLALGGKVVHVVGDLPTNTDMEIVILGGDLRDAAAIFEKHGDNMGRYMLGEIRRARFEDIH